MASKVGGGRGSLPQERTHQFVVQCQISLKTYILITLYVPSGKYLGINVYMKNIHIKYQLEKKISHQFEEEQRRVYGRD